MTESDTREEAHPKTSAPPELPVVAGPWLTQGRTVIIGGIAGVLLTLIGIALWPHGDVASPPASSVNTAPLPSPDPVGYPRPASGTDILAALRTGGGTLIVQNAGELDAVVVLDDSGDNSRGVYVRAGDQLTVPNVAAGTYRVRIATGRTWTDDRFISAASYQELERAITFAEREVDNAVEYTKLTVSFQASANDETGTKPSEPFPVAQRQ